MVYRSILLEHERLLPAMLRLTSFPVGRCTALVVVSRLASLPSAQAPEKKPVRITSALEKHRWSIQQRSNIHEHAWRQNPVSDVLIAEIVEGYRCGEPGTINTNIGC